MDGSNAGVVLDRCAEEGAQPQGEALNLPLHLHSILVGAERMRLWIQVAKISVLFRLAGVIRRDRVRSSVIQRGL